MCIKPPSPTGRTRFELGACWLLLLCLLHSLLYVAQVILDSGPPFISSIKLTEAPTTEEPLFKLLITFSEPVSWLANTTTSTTTANDTAVLSGTGSDATQMTMTATYSSSRLLLTNTALLNISMVAASAAVLASGEATNAGSAFELWFRSWGGAQALVEVLGPAYQDIAGNRGDRDTAYRVSTTNGLAGYA